jgi:hypothetical protein
MYMLLDFFKGQEKQQNKSVSYDEELISMVTSEFENRRKNRLGFELQWRLNINFVDGNQYVDINPVSNAIEDIKKYFWWESRSVYNEIAPIVETRLAKLIRLSPVLKTRPATSEKEDLASAKVSNKLLESTQREQKMRKIQMEANTWMEYTGTGIFKPVWNPNKGKKLGVIGYEDTQRVIKEGDIETVAVSPFEIFPDSNFNVDVESCKSIIHARGFHIKDIEMIWGVKENGQKINVFTLKQSSAGTGGLGMYNTAYSIATQTKEHHAIVYEYWEKPCSEYPNGRLIICTDSNLLYSGEIPYKNEDGEVYLPFIIEKCTERPNCFWGKSIVERLIPLQRQYNALKNRKTDHLNMTVIGVLSYEENSIDSDVLEMEGLAPGTMIPRKPGTAAPTFLQSPTLPAGFDIEEQNILKDFNRISGISEISRDSSAPTGVSSGIAISILQEQDDTRISLTGKYIEEANLELGKMWLMQYKQFVKFQRIVRCVGKDMDVDTIYWIGNDIKSFDVYIDGSTALSETPAQRQQKVIDIFNMGLFNDPDTGRITRDGQIRILQLLELGNWEFALSDDELHKQRASRENRMVQIGQPIGVRDYDEDVVHMNEHIRFMLSADYDDMVQDTPELDMQLNAHIEQHIANMQNKMPQAQSQVQPM